MFSPAVSPVMEAQPEKRASPRTSKAASNNIIFISLFISVLLIAGRKSPG
jgi:hypothetical protein